MNCDEIMIDCAFPAGNIILDRIEGDNVFIRHDLRDTSGAWFYWCFRIRGAAGRTIAFHFPENLIGARGPAISRDSGRTWSWLGMDDVRVSEKDTSFKCRFASSENELFFSSGMPYTETNLREFLDEHNANPDIRRGVLCTSRKGREVELIAIGRREKEPRFRGLITCRHHCCEMMASYTLEGIISEALSGSETGRWFHDNVECLIVPFVDKDGVEDGDQGKNRIPHDHNRDYFGEGIYPETRAIRRLADNIPGSRLAFALDLHCPYIRGGDNERFYLVGSKSEEMWTRQRAFSRILESVHTGPIPCRARNDIPYGQSWNVAANWQAGVCFSQWTDKLPGIRLSASFEVPYANAEGVEVNLASARALGHDMAKAIYTYLNMEQL